MTIYEKPNHCLLDQNSVAFKYVNKEKKRERKIECCVLHCVSRQLRCEPELGGCQTVRLPSRRSCKTLFCLSLVVPFSFTEPAPPIASNLRWICFDSALSTPYRVATTFSRESRRKTKQKNLKTVDFPLCWVARNLEGRFTDVISGPCVSSLRMRSASHGLSNFLVGVTVAHEKCKLWERIPS